MRVGVPVRACLGVYCDLEMQIHCLARGSMRLPSWAIALALVVACGADDARRPQQRSRAARYEHETSTATIEASTATPPPACNPGVKAITGSDATGTSPDFTNRTFFDRLQKQLILHWSPTVVLAHIDPAGRRYGDKTRSAEIRVCLSRAGELTGLTVTTSSGVSELDAEIVRVFRSAAPFLNPPEALAHGDGHIRFAYSFEFRATPPDKGPVMRVYPSRGQR
jgi:TonB family protein